jgi:SAM-dependent methyltransferase
MSLRPTGDAGADQITTALRSFYDADVQHRDNLIKQDWKLDERSAFLDRIQAAEARTLLELGAGTGQDSRFFADEGLTVTALDLSPAMTARTRERGVNALVGDLTSLDFKEGEFDAVYLHVPNTALPATLAGIRRVLKTGGLFYLGVYGGNTPEEGFSDDQRFFSFRTDHDLLTHAKAHFDILDFHAVHARDLRFQSLTLVSPHPSRPDAP